MAISSNHYLSEGMSIHKPPSFDGKDYTFWKTRMRIFIQFIDYELWETVRDGPHIPHIIVEGKIVKKEEGDWKSDDKRKHSLNAKAMNVLFCSLNAIEFKRIISCSSAKEIWHTLEVTHEGTNQVIESKISRLIHSYELFKMKSNETINETNTTFTDIINELHSYGKDFSSDELVRKMLRSLPKEWAPKVTAIEEAKDLKTLSLEELVGSLMTYELKLNDMKDEDKEKKKKAIAFNSSTCQEESDEDYDSEALGDIDPAPALVSKIDKVLKLRYGKKKFNNFIRNTKKKDPIICYGCNKPGHISYDCPQAKEEKKEKKEKKYKKKALKVQTWDQDSDDSSSEDDENGEVANMCFMALENEVKMSNSNDENMSFDELHETFEELVEEPQNVSLKNNDYKKKVSLLMKEVESLKREKNVLSSENDVLKKNISNESDLLKEIDVLKREKTSLLIENEFLKKNASSVIELQKENDDLKLTLEKFTNGRKNLELLLGSQRCV
ncbi:hypothetical protein LWI28_017061 [Acer negundo]|uniref:CCHC-type domain-containing protein n=1 Tax=Acer negundo TaxID=4023 RepID=A0AAD5NUV7_ACENE|nr:hypothetical protein LWI28_017061 [Acer negundo]